MCEDVFEQVLQEARNFLEDGVSINDVRDMAQEAIAENGCFGREAEQILDRIMSQLGANNQPRRQHGRRSNRPQTGNRIPPPADGGLKSAPYRCNP